MASMLAAGMAGCGTPRKLSPGDLGSMGVHEGAAYWQVEQRLASAGYRCFVSGAKREHFDCTKTLGVYPSCLLRVEFVADNQNQVSDLRVNDPACIGTP
ncbi:MAG: hypothetical protein JO142_06715 [Burkholderiales bacterium]|nr:hypothetical protein [Burkholderiales bacterium]